MRNNSGKKNLKGGDLGIDGRILLKLMKLGWEGVYWIHVAKDIYILDGFTIKTSAKIAHVCALPEKDRCCPNSVLLRRRWATSFARELRGDE